VRENRKFDQSPAQRVRSKEELRQTWETPKLEKSDDFGRCGEKAGERTGAFLRQPVHFCPQCGQFLGMKMTLFCGCQKWNNAVIP